MVYSMRGRGDLTCRILVLRRYRKVLLQKVYLAICCGYSAFLFKLLDIHEREGLYVWVDITRKRGCICGVQSKPADFTKMFLYFIFIAERYT